jgi:D-alanine-D-alanine ligase
VAFNSEILSQSDQDSSRSIRRVAVLSGGYSAEREISLQSGSQVAEHLKRFCEVSLIDVGRDQWIDTRSGTALNRDRFALEDQEPFDAAFLTLHGTPGEDGLVPAYLQLLDIPHNTSDLRASSLSFDKDVCKRLISGSSVSLARSEIWKESDLGSRSTALNYPIFVKPIQNGSSCGISMANEESELHAALQAALKLDAFVMLEEGIIGKELTCAVYRKDGHLHTLPVCEVRPGADHAFFNYEAKYTQGQAEEIIPAPIEDELLERVKEASMEVYDMLQLSGLARVDYIFSNDELYFLEVNTIPGMSDASIVPRMLKATGIDPGRFYFDLLLEAQNRLRHR